MYRLLSLDIADGVKRKKKKTDKGRLWVWPAIKAGWGVRFLDADQKQIEIPPSLHMAEVASLDG